MKKIRIIVMMLALMVSVGSAFGKKDPEAKKVLDAVAAKLNSCGGIRAQFVVTAFTGTTAQGSESGTFLTDGKRFQMKSAEMTTWFDGKTQWSYFADTEEVNVATPTEAELQVMNPYAFIGIYKTGFHYTMKAATYQGKAVDEIRLVAEKKKQDIQRIILTVDKTTKLPLCVRILQGKKTWTRINISNFKSGQTFGAETFRFDKSKYPNAEVVDLR